MTAADLEADIRAARGIPVPRTGEPVQYDNDLGRWDVPIMLAIAIGIVADAIWLGSAPA